MRPHAVGSPNASYTYLYVTDPLVDELEILNPVDTIVKTITTGLHAPLGDFVDAKGNLYVANTNNCSGGNVVEYAHGSTSPSYTYTSGIVCPMYAGADGSGHVFVFDDGNGAGNYLLEFDQKKNAPIARWNTCNSGTFAFCYPTGLALGGAGHVFLTMYGAVRGSLNSSWVVDEVLYQLKSNNQTYVTGYEGPAGGLALDSKHNILVGANPVPPSERARPAIGTWGIVKSPYPYGHGSDYHPSNLDYVGFTYVSALALSADQKTLFVADYGGGTLTLLTYPDGKFIKSLGIVNGLTDPDGVALGPAP
jgi:hypothetical protein